MESVASVLILGGFGLLAIGGLWLLGQAFGESFLWGIGVLIVPFCWVIFVILHLDKTWKPAAVALLGVAMMIGGGIIKGPSTSSGPPPGYMMNTSPDAPIVRLS